MKVAIKNWLSLTIISGYLTQILQLYVVAN